MGRFRGTMIPGWAGGARAAWIVAALAMSCAHAPAQTPSRQPLTMAGKTSLYQRVIAVPGATVNDTAGRTAAEGEPVTPFTVFYVYGRRQVGEQTWLEVGTGSDGRVRGWLSSDQAIAWKQTLTVGFRDPAAQERVLLFGERDPLADLVERHDVQAYRELRRQAEQGIAADSPVVAIQPEGYIDIRNNFYLVPILDHENILVGEQQGRLLHVATVPLRDPLAGGARYRAGVAFVIDSTVSMGPYIDRTRTTMRRVYDAIEKAELSGAVSFALISYRDSTQAVPGLEYVTRLHTDLESGTRGEAFLSKVRAVQPATVSSTGFDEDAYAGIKQALEELDWSGYDARYVILITDAGPRTSGDPLASTGLDTESLRRLALDKGVALWVMHLRTPEGTENHAPAEREYRRLSHIDEIGDFYYPVEAGDPDSYEHALSALTEQLTGQVRGVNRGLRPRRAAGPPSAGAVASELEAFQDKIAKLGYALRMRFLQEHAGGGIPVLFDAWLLDRDFDAPDTRSVDVRVLLTRDQLSDLHEVLERVLATAEEGALAPEDFLDDLKSLAATVSRDPEAATSATRAVAGESLADLGFLREYIEGLPYQSTVMDLDLGTWQQWSAQRQFEFINELDGKIAYYRALHDNLDLWVSLDGGPVDGDSVYPLLLEALP